MSYRLRLVFKKEWDIHKAQTMFKGLKTYDYLFINTSKLFFFISKKAFKSISYRLRLVFVKEWDIHKAQTIFKCLKTYDYLFIMKIFLGLLHWLCHSNEWSHFNLKSSNCILCIVLDIFVFSFELYTIRRDTLESFLFLFF